MLKRGGSPAVAFVKVAYAPVLTDAAFAGVLREQFADGFQIFRRVHAVGFVAFHADHADRDAVFQKAQLLQFFPLFQRRLRQADGRRMWH